MEEIIVKTSFNFIKNIAEFFIALIYFCNFLNIKTKNKTMVIIAGFVFSIFHTAVNYLGSPILNNACGFMLLLFCSFVIFSDNWMVKFSITAVFVVLSATSELLVMFIFLLIRNTYMFELLNDLYMYILGGLLSKLILYFFATLLTKAAPNKYHIKNTSNILLLSCYPILSLVAMYVLLNYSSYNIISFIEHIFIYILLICILSSSIISFFVYDNLLLNADLKSQLELSKKAEQINKAIFDEKERSLEINQRYIHDLKRNLEHIHLLYKKGDSTNAQIYESQLLLRLESQIKASIFRVGNPIVSDSLERARILCEMDGIVFTADIMFNQLGFIEYLDASTLFDNIIDNAIYACKDMKSNKWFRISLKAKNNYLYLSAQNSKTNIVVERHGMLLSTKRGYKKAGAGIENIRSVAEKYGGDIVIEHLDDEFRITMRLRIPDRYINGVLTEQQESFA